MNSKVQKYSVSKEVEMLTPTDDEKIKKLGQDMNEENISVDLFISAEHPVV